MMKTYLATGGFSPAFPAPQLTTPSTVLTEVFGLKGSFLRIFAKSYTLSYDDIASKWADVRSNEKGLESALHTQGLKVADFRPAFYVEGLVFASFLKGAGIVHIEQQNDLVLVNKRDAAFADLSDIVSDAVLSKTLDGMLVAWQESKTSLAKVVSQSGQIMTMTVARELSRFWSKTYEIFFQERAYMEQCLPHLLGLVKRMITQPEKYIPEVLSVDVLSGVLRYSNIVYTAINPTKGVGTLAVAGNIKENWALYAYNEIVKCVTRKEGARFKVVNTLEFLSDLCEVRDFKAGDDAGYFLRKFVPSHVVAPSFSVARKTIQGAYGSDTFGITVDKEGGMKIDQLFTSLSALLDWNKPVQAKLRFAYGKDVAYEVDPRLADDDDVVSVATAAAICYAKDVSYVSEGKLLFEYLPSPSLYHLIYGIDLKGDTVSTTYDAFRVIAACAQGDSGSRDRDSIKHQHPFYDVKETDIFTSTNLAALDIRELGTFQLDVLSEDGSVTKRALNIAHLLDIFALPGEFVVGNPYVDAIFKHQAGEWSKVLENANDYIPVLVDLVRDLLRLARAHLSTATLRPRATGLNVFIPKETPDTVEQVVADNLNTLQALVAVVGYISESAGALVGDIIQTTLNLNSAEYVLATRV